MDQMKREVQEVMSSDKSILVLFKKVTVANTSKQVEV